MNASILCLRRVGVEFLVQVEPVERSLEEEGRRWMCHRRSGFMSHGREGRRKFRYGSSSGDSLMLVQCQDCGQRTILWDLLGLFLHLANAANPTTAGTIYAQTHPIFFNLDVLVGFLWSQSVLRASWLFLFGHIPHRIRMDRNDAAR